MRLMHTDDVNSMKNMNPNFNWQKTPCISPSRLSYGLSTLVIPGKYGCVIMTLHSIYGKGSTQCDNFSFPARICSIVRRLWKYQLAPVRFKAPLLWVIISRPGLSKSIIAHNQQLNFVTHCNLAAMQGCRCGDMESWRKNGFYWLKNPTHKHVYVFVIKINTIWAFGNSSFHDILLSMDSIGKTCQYISIFLVIWTWFCIMADYFFSKFTPEWDTPNLRIDVQWNLSITTTSIIRFITCDKFSIVF